MFCPRSIEFTGVLKGNVSGPGLRALILTPSETYVRLGHARRVAGEVKIPILVREAENISGVKIDLLYDSRSLEFESAVPAGLAEGYASAHRVSQDSIFFAMASSGSFMGNGRIATLIFNRKGPAGAVPGGTPKVRLDAVLFNEGTPAAVIEGDDHWQEVVEIGLGPVTPNPFAGSTVITYCLPAPSRVAVSVYDVNGRLVRTLVEGDVEAGVHTAAWDGHDGRGVRVAKGVYFCRMTAGDYSAAEKVVLLK
jgi:hypothetical protein